jgi:hypothetical protein
MGTRSPPAENVPDSTQAVPRACRCKRVDAASADERVLILTSRPRDAELICTLLMKTGIGCYIAASLADLASAIDTGAAVAIIT